MRKITIPVCILILLLQFSIRSFAGNGKLYIATNKESYIPSEPVQFEIFLLNATSTLTTVYVELLDCKGNNVAKKMLPLYSNTSWGHVDLPEAADVEFYILYCYVLNKDTIQSHYLKKIFVNSGDLQLKKETGNELLLEYFLEGGSFVADLPNNLLVSTKDENGNAISAAGKIIDEKDSVVNRFVTNEMGIAKLNINPELSVKYFIIIDNKKGNKIKEALPMAAEYGVSLSVTANADSIKYRVFSYAENEDQFDYKLEIIADNETIYKSEINFPPDISFVTKGLSSKLLPMGFLTFRLTDKNNRFYAKRIIFNNYESANISTLKIIDTISNKVAEVSIPDYVNGNGYLNILIKDKGDIKTTANPEENLVIKKGRTDEITFNDLLITCGEIPFQNPKKINDDSLLTLSGIAYSSENKILKNKKINFVLQYKNLMKDFLVATTDYSGKFEIKGLQFYDSAVVYYQLADKSEEKNNIRIDLKVTPNQSFASKGIMLGNFICATKTGITGTVSKKSNQNITIIKPDKREKTLSEVTVNTEKIRENVDSKKYQEKNVSGQHNRTNFMRTELDLIANPQVIDNMLLLDFIRGRMSSLEISVRSSGQILISEISGSGIGVYLDDMDITLNPDLIANLQVRDVALVRFYSFPLKPRSHRTRTKYDDPLVDPERLSNSGMGGGGGDLMIYTKKDFSPSTQNIKGLAKTHIVGYDLNAEIKLNSPEVFYWKPNWTKQKEQTIYIGIPANNAEKNTQLIIEGINPVQARYTFTKNLVFN